MTPVERIVKNSMVLSSGHVIAKLINIALVLILTRLLGTTGFGLYSFSFAFTTMFMLFTHLGMNTYLVRHIATDRGRASESLSAAMPMVIAFSVLALLLINLTALFANWPSAERGVIFLFSLFLLFDSWSRFLFAVFRAFERMQFEALVIICERVALLAVALWCLAINARLELVVALFAGVQLLKAGFTYGLVRRHFISLKPRWDRRVAFGLLRRSFPFALMILFATITVRIDIVMLKLFHSTDAAGLYSVGRRLIESLSFLPENIVSALFPALSVLYLSDRTKFNRTFGRAMRYMVIPAIPLAAIIFTYAPQIVETLFAPEFAPASVALRWLAIWLGLLFIKHLLAVTLGAIDKQRVFSVIAGLGMLLNIVLNLMLIPRYEVLGACVATVGAEIISTIAALIVVRGALGIGGPGSSIGKIFAAGLVVCIGLYAMRGWNAILGAALAAGGYVLLLFVLKAITDEDRRQFGRLVRNGLAGLGGRGR